MLKVIQLVFITAVFTSGCSIFKTPPNSTSLRNSSHSCFDDNERLVPVSLMAGSETLSVNDVNGSIDTELGKPNEGVFQLRLDFCVNDFTMSTQLIRYAILENNVAKEFLIGSQSGSNFSALVFQSSDENFSNTIQNKVVCSNFTVNCERFANKSGLKISTVKRNNELLFVIRKWNQQSFTIESEKEFDKTIYYGLWNVGEDFIAPQIGNLVCPIGLKPAENKFTSGTIKMNFEYCFGGHSDAQLFTLRRVAISNPDVTLSMPKDKSLIDLIIVHHNFSDKLTLKVSNQTFKFELVNGKVEFTVEESSKEISKNVFECRHFFGCVGDEDLDLSNPMAR